MLGRGSSRLSTNMLPTTKHLHTATKELHLDMTIKETCSVMSLWGRVNQIKLMTFRSIAATRAMLS